MGSTNVRYALEPLANFNFSFSPGFSLGSVALLKAENRFNGLHRDIDHFGTAPETVKTVAEIQCAAVTPRLKPGENEKLNFARGSEAYRTFVERH